MEITKISVQAKNSERVNLYVDGKFYRGLDRLVAIKLGLKSGLTLNPTLLDKLETTQSENSAWEWALRSLQVSPKSKREMLQRLNRKFEPELATAVMLRLSSAGLIDDRKMAEQMVQRFVQQGTKSKKEILLKLRQKGIEFDVAKGAVEQTPNDTLAAVTIAVMRNRALKDSLTWQTRYEKIASYLARKGFNYADIKRAVTRENLDRETN